MKDLALLFKKCVFKFNITLKSFNSFFEKLPILIGN